MENIINYRMHNDLQEIIDRVVADLMQESGAVNLAEFSRRTGISRGKARLIKTNGFKLLPHGNYGQTHQQALAGFTGVVDDLLRKGVTNSSVCLERLKETGYTGGLTTVKNYIKAHKDLVPAKRKLSVEPQSKGIRYQTRPGEAYQMDWGFTNVQDWNGYTYKIACFAMVCHHCGTCYIEFFLNARQENLFIGIVHAFMIMGIPDVVLTDNMKSVVIKRDIEGKPIWQHDYEEFMNTIGFKTKLCKPYHPFTKGKVERLVRFVKDNFLAGRTFLDITQLNTEALEWCAKQSNHYRRALDLIPANEHESRCLPAARTLILSNEIAAYLCPIRKISFDGFICYEGRRFGVPWWYTNKICRVNRDGSTLHIYSEDLSQELTAHPVTWSYKDSFCDSQYADIEPCELPSAPVKTTISQLEPPKHTSGLEKFDFEGRL